MKSAQLLTFVLGMLACTHSHSDTTLNLKDSIPANCLVKSTPPAAVVNVKKPVVNAAPELPFFKDVLDSKRLFW